LLPEHSVGTVGNHFVADVDYLQLEEVVPWVFLDKLNNVAKDLAVAHAGEEGLLSQLDHVEDKLN
jgi:hypothetical protein